MFYPPDIYESMSFYQISTFEYLFTRCNCPAVFQLYLIFGLRQHHVEVAPSITLEQQKDSISCWHLVKKAMGHLFVWHIDIGY